MVREIEKDGTLKSRLVARGFTQLEGKLSFRPLSTWMVETIMISFAVSVQKSWTPYAADCTQAFLQPEIPDFLKDLLYIKLPRDLNLGPTSEYQGGQIRSLRKLIYGCKHSGRIWQQFVTEIMLQYNGTVQSGKDQSTFYLRNEGEMVGIVIIMIDDILCLSEESTWKQLFGYLKSKLKITGGDVASVWNGYELEKQSDGSLRVSQTKQIMETLKNLDIGGRECTLSDTPEDAKSKNWTSKEFMDDSGLNGPINKLYQSVLWLPFILVTSLDLTWLMQCPAVVKWHVQHLKQISRVCSR